MNLLFRNAINYFTHSHPFELTIFITTHCNFRCTHCFYWEELNNKDQLTLEEFTSLAKSIPSVERLIFTGGEPFLRKDIDQIILAFYKYSKPTYITIPTNGYYTETTIEKTRKILEGAPDSFVNISLSLDDLGEKRDEFVKIEGSFEQLRITVKELKKLRSSFSNLGLTVICTQTAENEDHLEEIYRYAIEEFQIDNFGFSVVRGNPEYPEIKNIDPEKYAAMTQKLSESYKQPSTNGAAIPFKKLYQTNREMVYEYTYKTLTEPKHHIKCHSGNLRAVILENGKVFPCEVLMDNNIWGKPDDFLLGNLRDFEMDFTRLWSSPRRQDILQKISCQKCFCTHGCDMTVNTLFNNKFPLTVLKKLLPN